MDILTGHCSDQANVCWLCGARCESSIKKLGDRKVCNGCYRQVREVAINMDKQEAEAPNEKSAPLRKD